jgi:hypothetical protein
MPITCMEHTKLVDSINELRKTQIETNKLLMVVATKIDNLVTRRELDGETEKLRGAIHNNKIIFSSIFGILTAIGGALIYMIK